MASWIDALRSRCGPFADAATRFAAAEGVEIDPPRGVAALRVLHCAIERHRSADIEDAETERRFVERAGAFLAAVLADHIGEGRHGVRDGRHRLAFGDARAFDPFEGIERILGARDSGGALAGEVAFAEGIARGGPGPSHARDERWPDARARILPRLVGSGFAATLGRAGDGVFAEPLFGDIRLALVLRYPGRARFVRSGERARWPADACHVAIDNLARSSGRAKLLRVDGDEGRFVVARSADGLDSARLLLPGLHDVLAPEVGSPFVVAVPHRDALFACAARDAVSVAAMRSRTRLEHARARHGISAALYLVHLGTRITPYPPDARHDSPG